MNVKTPGAGRRSGAFGNVAVGTADVPDLAHHTPEIQSARLRKHFKLTPAVAAVIAGHLHAVPEHWSTAR